MSRPAVVIWDEDGVLFKWTAQMNVYCDRPADEVWDTWTHYKTWGMTSPEFLAKLNQFGLDGGFADGEPHWDGIMAWHALASHARIGCVSITAKPNVAAFEDAAAWLSSYGIRMTRYCSDDKTILHGQYKGREMFALDDNVGHVEALLAKGVRAYLRDQPWNQDATHLPRVFDALEFARIVYDYVEG